jgi:hypothetical protein
MLKFIFGPQQIFFQLFMRNTNRPDTHTTVGALIRIRENIKEHNGKYVYRWDELGELEERERRRDKKRMFYYTKKKSYENFRNLIVFKKLIHPKLGESDETKLQKVKKELLLKKLRKKNKNAEDIVILNKRGNPKTEPLYAKSQRRRFST